MQVYEVRISHTAHVDMANLRAFLNTMLSEDSAIRYANNMRTEIKMLSVYAIVLGEQLQRHYAVSIQRLVEWYRIITAGYTYSILKETM